MLKATSKVYTLGDIIGLTHKAVYDVSVLQNAIKRNSVPLVSSFEGIRDPSNVIGHAELKIVNDDIVADITFNDQHADTIKEALEHGYKPRTGFYATKVKHKKDTVTSMEIRAVAMNETCLGGDVYDLKEV